MDGTVLAHKHFVMNGYVIVISELREERQQGGKVWGKVPEVLGAVHKGRGLEREASEPYSPIFEHLA